MADVKGIAVWLAFANAIAFVTFWHDKQAAISGMRRVPERRLLWLAAAGGTIGAIAAQYLFRQKTRKEPFRTIFQAIVAVQLAGFVVWLADPDLPTQMADLVVGYIAPI